MTLLIVGNPMGIQVTSPDQSGSDSRPRPDLKSSPSPCTPGSQGRFCEQRCLKRIKIRFLVLLIRILKNTNETTS